MSYYLPAVHWQPREGATTSGDCNASRLATEARYEEYSHAFPRLHSVSRRALLLALLFLPGCGNNTLNPFCGSARPAPLIGSLSPSTTTYSELQQGVMLTVNGSHFVAASQVVINTTPLAATVMSDQQLKVKLSADVISGPGTVKVRVLTPSGNSADVGCTSGGTSSVLVLTVN